MIMVEEIFTLPRKISDSPLENSIETLCGDISELSKNIAIEKKYIESDPIKKIRHLILDEKRIKLVEEISDNTCKIHYQYESSEDTDNQFSDYTTTYLINESIEAFFNRF